MAVPTYGSVVDTTTTTSAAPGLDPEIETADAAPLVDDVYDSDPTNYLKNGAHSYNRWTTQRIWNLLLPLLVAGLLMGGAATYLLRDFNHLYPGRDNGGSTTTDTSRSIPSSTITKNTYDKSHSESYTTSSSSNSGSKPQRHKVFTPPNDNVGASCSLHPDCSILIGNCCPTVEGKTLECCNI